MSAGDLTWLPLLLPVLLLQGIMTTLAQRNPGAIVVATCGMEKERLSNDTFSMYAQVNAVRSDEPHSYSNETAGTIYCNHHDKDNVLKSYIELEIVLEGDPPSNIELHAGPLFLHSLAHSTLNCYYKDIGPGHRIEKITSADLQPSPLSKHYICVGIEDFSIILQGVPNHPSPSSGRQKRSAVQPLERKCARFSGVHNGNGYSQRGQFCNATDGGPGIGMFNEEGEPDCLPCCAGYHWSEPLQQCHKCPPCTARPEPNVFKRCPWIGCNDPPTSSPTNVPTTEHIPSYQPTSSSTEATTLPNAPVRIFRPPMEVPKGLRLVTKNRISAFIIWNEVISTTLEPVEKYVVELTNVESKKSEEFKAKGIERWMNLTDLTPMSKYNVRICAANTAGYGNWSNNLKIHTTRIPPALSNVNVTTDQQYIVVTWTPEKNTGDLNVSVEYWRDEELQSAAVTISMQCPRNEIRFFPNNVSSYRIQAFYSNHEGDGPRSGVFQISYEAEIALEYVKYIPLWIILVIVVLVLLIVLIFICDWTRTAVVDCVKATMMDYRLPGPH